MGKLGSPPSSIYERLAMRHRLGECGTFDKFVDQFEYIFDQRSLFSKNEISIQHVSSGLCLSVDPDDEADPASKRKDMLVNLRWRVCIPSDRNQRFIPIAGNSRVRSVLYERCLQNKGNRVSIENCDFNNNSYQQFFRLNGNHQLWNGNPTALIRGAGNGMCLARPKDNAITMEPCGDSEEIYMQYIFPGF